MPLAASELRTMRNIFSHYIRYVEAYRSLRDRSLHGYMQEYINKDYLLNAVCTCICYTVFSRIFNSLAPCHKLFSCTVILLSDHY